MYLELLFVTSLSLNSSFEDAYYNGTCGLPKALIPGDLNWSNMLQNYNQHYSLVLGSNQVPKSCICFIDSAGACKSHLFWLFESYRVGWERDENEAAKMCEAWL